MKNFIKLFSFVSIFCFLTSNVRANVVYSFKQVTDTYIGSDKSCGTALYGDSEFDRRSMSLTKPKILMLSNKKQLKLGNKEYKYLGSSGAQSYYAHSYHGLVEVYDRSKNEVTLYKSRTNGNNNQRSNYMEVQLWHCNS